MKKTILIIAVVLGLYSCTANVRVRRWGGTEKIVLEDHEVLLNATWKENELWVLTKDTISNVSHFREHSSWGVVEGEIILK